MYNSFTNLLLDLFRSVATQQTLRKCVSVCHRHHLRRHLHYPPLLGLDHHRRSSGRRGSDSYFITSAIVSSTKIEGGSEAVHLTVFKVKRTDTVGNEAVQEIN